MTSESLTGADGRDGALAAMLAKRFQGAVPHPHRATDVRQEGYGPAGFKVAILDGDGLPSGRFAKVTVEMYRNAELADVLRAEIEAER